MRFEAHFRTVADNFALTAPSVVPRRFVERVHRYVPPVWLALGAILLVAIVLTLVAADRVLGAPRHDLELLGWFLTISGIVSLALGAAAIGWVGNRVGSVKRRLALAYVVGLLIATANVLTTSALMFLSTHDLGLLLLLLAFAGVISIAFASAVAGVLTRQIQTLSNVAGLLAQGDLSARVGQHGSDEIGRLAHAFDDMAEQVQLAFAHERALEKSRRDLMTSVSHDLRTPLATTRAMVEALADGVVTQPDDVRRYLALILQETQHLNQLIDDLFELGQIDGGVLRLHCVQLDLAELVSETVAAYDLAAAEREIHLEQLVTPAIVDGDPDRLQRVLRNLLDNALHHTPRGGRVQVGTATEEAKLVRLSVDDSGPGVPDSELERIFDRFYRREPSRLREANAGGAGLGLAIARGLVQAHQGQMWAEPSPLGGMSIQIRLPLAA
jgi:signal transduction histidine kinase